MSTQTEHPNLFCEYEPTGDCGETHHLHDWQVEYTHPGSDIRLSVVVVAGCSYAAEEALYDRVEVETGERGARVWGLREVES